MPANYVLLEKISVGAAGASSVTFSGIPQTGYTDLVVKFSTRFNGSSNDYVYLQFNSDTNTSNYKSLFLRGNGSTAASASVTTEGKIRVGITTGNAETANTFSNCEIYIPNYTGSTNKSTSSDWVIENNATATFMGITAGLWSQTTAITSIQLTLPSNSFVQYSTFYLYGVAKLGTTPAIVPYATGGDTIMTDGTYWYHAFLSSGTFTPAKALSADVLTVAGGGAGGPVFNFSTGGGGGAGGYKLQLAQSLTAINYTCTIGAGGAGGSSAGANGSNSSMGSISGTIDGGGGGGSNASSGGTRSGANGGSGGGAGGGGLGSFSGGTATAGQGSTGGAYTGSGNEGAGGGGFAAVGSTQSSVTPGVGGVGAGGVSYGDYLVLNGIGAATGLGQLSGGNYYFAGGGSSIGSGQALGGGGLGGGYNTTTFINPGSAGTANTGGGGGTYGYAGSSGPALQNGYNGGSGIVIVRYLV